MTTRSIYSPDERDESADEQAESEASTGHACPDCGGSLVTD
ncbi:transcription initiation factor IIB 2, partial [Haloarcula sp. JP-Z28]|nr:transcription initiation factor IIB 2 [Haloarcula sp. JP-Z28]